MARPPATGTENQHAVAVSTEDLEATRQFLSARPGRELAVLFVDRLSRRANGAVAEGSMPYLAALDVKLRSEYVRLARDAVEGPGAGAVLAAEGNSLLALFSSAAAAVEAALRIQRDALRANRGRAEAEQLRLRAALDAVPLAGSPPGGAEIGGLLYRAGALADAAGAGQLLVARGAASRLKIGGGPQAANGAGGSPPAVWRRIAPPLHGIAGVPGALWEVTASLPEPASSGGAQRGILAAMVQRARAARARARRAGAFLAALCILGALGGGTLLFNRALAERATQRAVPQPPAAPPVSAHRPRQDPAAFVEIPRDGAGDVLTGLAADPERFNPPASPAHLVLSGRLDADTATLRFSAGVLTYLRVFHLDRTGRPAMILTTPAVLLPGREETMAWDAPPTPGQEQVVMLASAMHIEEADGLLPAQQSRGSAPAEPYFQGIARLMRDRSPSSSPPFALALATLSRAASGRVTLNVAGLVK